MKRKIAALLMGTTLSVAVCGYSVQAMTYGYDMEERYLSPKILLFQSDRGRKGKIIRLA